MSSRPATSRSQWSRRTPSAQVHRNPIEFRVEDFEAARAELTSRGVEFKGEPIDSGVCLQAFFEDPDGNLLGIHHRYTPGVPPAASDDN